MCASCLVGQRVRSLNFCEDRWNLIVSRAYDRLAAIGWGTAMTASEIVSAYEAGIITEFEATEQGMVDTLDDLYSRLTSERHHRAERPRRVAGLHRQH